MLTDEEELMILIKLIAALEFMLAERRMTPMHDEYACVGRHRNGSGSEVTLKGAAHYYNSLKTHGRHRGGAYFEDRVEEKLADIRTGLINANRLLKEVETLVKKTRDVLFSQHSHLNLQDNVIKDFYRDVQRIPAPIVI